MAGLRREAGMVRNVHLWPRRLCGPLIATPRVPPAQAQVLRLVDGLVQWHDDVAVVGHMMGGAGPDNVQAAEEAGEPRPACLVTAAGRWMGAPWH